MAVSLSRRDRPNRPIGSDSSKDQKYRPTNESWMDLTSIWKDDQRKAKIKITRDDDKPIFLCGPEC